MTGDFIALAERVERATGADRELDAVIAATIRVCHKDWRWAEGYPAWEGRADGRVYLCKGGPSFEAPSFTASLDAALSLVPEGWVVASLEWWPMRDRGGVCLREVKDFDAIGGYGFGFDETCGDARANARTAPLALVAAALRARAQESGQ